LYERTNQPAALGMVGLALFLPVLLLSLPAGHAADRYSRKWLLLAATVLAAVASLGLAALSFLEGPVLLIYVCLLLSGVAQAFSAPARWSLVPQVVPDEALANAVTWNSSGWQIASMVGPALGGAVLTVTRHAAWAYLLAAFCSVVSAGLVAPIQPRPATRQPEPISAGSLGALLMAVVLAHRPPLRQAGRALLVAVAGFGAATVLFGLSHNPLLSFLMLALTGALDNISVVVRGTLVQVLTPDPVRGRVTAVNAIFIGSSNELGAFESGLTAQWFGPVPSVVGGGIGTILVVLAVMLRWPQVLRLGRLGAVEAESALVEEDLLASGEHPAPRR
jgi:MFS family permease